MNKDQQGILSPPNLTLFYSVLALAVLALSIVGSARIPQLPDLEPGRELTRLQSQISTLTTFVWIGYISSFLLALLALIKSVFGWYSAQLRLTTSFVVCIFYFILFAFHFIGH